MGIYLLCGMLPLQIYYDNLLAVEMTTSKQKMINYVTNLSQMVDYMIHTALMTGELSVAVSSYYGTLCADA